VTVRLLLADDQPLARAGLEQIVTALGHEVVAIASNGREAVEMAEATRPDVCLLDIRMPVMDGIEATRRLAGPSVARPIPVVILTTFDLDEYVSGALDAGASGFLLKDCGPTLIGEAITAAVNGEALIAPAITVRFLEHFSAHERGGTGNDPGGVAVEAGLSEREQEVVQAVARGLTNAEIGDELHMSLGTVKSHLTSVQQKLGVRNRVEIAAWAWRNGVAR